MPCSSEAHAFEQKTLFPIFKRYLTLAGQALEKGCLHLEHKKVFCIRIEKRVGPSSLTQKAFLRK